MQRDHGSLQDRTLLQFAAVLVVEPRVQFIPDSAIVPQTGNGDVAVDLEWRRARLVAGDVKLALTGVQLPAARGTAGSCSLCSRQWPGLARGA